MTIDEAKEAIKEYGLDFDAVPESAKIERRFRTALRIAVECIEELAWYHSQDLINRNGATRSLELLKDEIRMANWDYSVIINQQHEINEMEYLIKHLPKAEPPRRITNDGTRKYYHTHTKTFRNR